MIFRNSHWKRAQIGSFVGEIKEMIPNPVEAGYTKYIGFEHIKPENLYLSELGDLSDGVRFIKKFRKGDILFGKIRAYLKKVAIAPIDGICSGDIIVLRTKNEKIIDQGLLPYFLITQSFLKRAIDSSNGTTLPRTNWQHLSKHSIPLPSLREQKQIVALLQSIEIAIWEVEEQGKKLKELRKSLCKGLLLKEPVFGNLLTKENWSTIKFSNITDSIEKHDKNKMDVNLFVGLENIEPEDFTIKTWGNIEDGTTFTKRFKKGDVLFGKRRAYLKKVAVADFDGICSSDILVLRAKQDKMIPELLPFYVSAEPFIQYAVSTSAGSLSPRTKWKDLGQLEVSLPQIEIQKKILAVLQSVECTRNQLVLQKSNLKKLKQQLLNDILG